MPLLAALPIAAHHATAQQRYEFSEVHMGMAVRIVAYAPANIAARDAARAAFARIAALDSILSDYRPHSELRRLEGRTGDWMPVGADLLSVLRCALRVAQASQGAFDPTVGPLSALWREARRAGRPPDKHSLAAVQSRVGYQHLELDTARSTVRLARPGMRLDLGGIAKGYVIQQALNTLRAHGVSQAMIEAGGDIVVGDPPPGSNGWAISVAASPELADRASRLANAALSTSGPGAQHLEWKGARYSHVVDPSTGLGLTNRLTAHVIAPDAMLADALSTALTVLGPDRGAELLRQFSGAIASVR